MINRIKRFITMFKWRKYSKQMKYCGKYSTVGKKCDVYGAEYISVGDHFYAMDNLKLQAYKSYCGIETGFTPNLKIGNHVSFMSNCLISCANEIVIGDGTLFGDNVFITDNLHGSGKEEELDIPPIERPLCIKGKIKIGKNVWIGRNVCIMPNVTIGDGAIIGANAVVTHNVPSKDVVAGVPAKSIKNK